MDADYDKLGKIVVFNCRLVFMSNILKHLVSLFLVLE